MQSNLVTFHTPRASPATIHIPSASGYRTLGREARRWGCNTCADYADMNEVSRPVLELSYGYFTSSSPRYSHAFVAFVSFTSCQS